MIKTKWILSCLVALGTLLTASAQAQNFSTSIPITRFGVNDGTYQVTINNAGGTTFNVTAVQTNPGPNPTLAYVDALSFSFVDGANLPITVNAASGKTTGPPPTNFPASFGASGIGSPSVTFSDAPSPFTGPLPNTGPGGNISLNAFNTFSGTITLNSTPFAVTVSLAGNGGSGNNFVTSLTPESNGSLLLLAALLPIGILVARRRSAKSAV